MIRKRKIRFKLTIQRQHNNPFMGFIMLSLFLILYCNNPFKTRDAEEPDGSSVTFIQPTSPEIVIANMITSLRERNATNYMKCFNLDNSISFNFIPDPSAKENYLSALSDWDLNKESAYITSLFFSMPEDSLANLNLEGVEEYVFADSAMFIKIYTLQMHHTAAEAPRDFSGRLDFGFKRLQSGLWVISSWADYRTEDKPVWSELKASFVF
ncbi:hypothetical protein ACFL4T_08825 [candidate division KSB1 bacterium]